MSDVFPTLCCAFCVFIVLLRLLLLFLLLPSNNNSNNCIDVKLGDEVGLIGAFAFLTFVCHLDSFQSCDVYASFFKRPMPASRRPGKSLHWHQVLALQFSHMLYCSTTFGTGTLETTNFDSSILFSRRTATKDCRIQRVELLEPAFCRTTLSIVSLRSEPRFPGHGAGSRSLFSSKPLWKLLPKFGRAWVE